jgi:hypothetical protein
MSACCMCCVIEYELAGLDHATGDCPGLPCDYCQGCTCPIWEADDYYGWQACPQHGPVVS